MKTVCPQGHQGSNPCGSAKENEVTPISWTDVTIYGGTFMLITRETKLEIVKKHLEDGVTLKALSEQYGIHTSNIKFYIALYRKHGESVFTNESRNKVYTREFKLQVIKRYMNGNESMRTIAVDLGFTDPGMVRDWVNKYKAGGEDAIQASTRRKNYLLHEERQDKIASDELKERIKYLEAENEYLKKSYSLILERNRQSKKK